MRVVLSIAEALGPLFIKFLGATCRYNVIGSENHKAAHEMDKGVIYGIWHGRMLLPIYNDRDNGLVAMVSKHRDGEIIARIVAKLGYELRRGSPKEGGREAFKEMLQDLRDKKTVVVLPDGPTGPRHFVRDGIVMLARMTGAPILPLSYSAASHWRIKSWDRFMIMKPLSKGVVVFGKPFVIPRHLPEGADDKLFHRQIQEALVVVEQQADSLMNHPKEPVEVRL